MPRSGRSTRRYLADTNVYVAAVKRSGRITPSRRLLEHFLNDPRIELVGNAWWLEELLRYAEESRSEAALELAEELAQKVEILELAERFVAACSELVGAENPVDTLHAATCLQSDATLISNDPDFDRIRDAHVIRVLSITEALKRTRII